MKVKHSLSLFMFRRDLRINDNTGLLRACRESKWVIPSFFFHRDLIDEKSQKFRPNLIQFMLESLIELDKDLRELGSKLYLFYGDDLHKEFEGVLKSEKIEAVYVNEDHTPYSIKRDEMLSSICKENKVDFISCFDLLLNHPEKVVTMEGKPYRVFTPFYKKGVKQTIPEPDKEIGRNFFNNEVSRVTTIDVTHSVLNYKNRFLAQKGGRVSSVKILSSIKKFKNYNEERDFPSIAGTTKLSAHLKFGTVSVREVYWAVRKGLGLDNVIISELFWRDFYATVAYFFPYVFCRSFSEKYENIKWENDESKFKAWCDGETGFPIVDAGMRQLNKTGWMHNRVRMIVASFLTKDLHVSWRWGERYFASKLVDYDPCSNNGGWQWAASTGADSQPYFRIFNPWRQQKRFDPEADYIREWVPELNGLSATEIHNENKPVVKGYPSPIVDHTTEAKLSKEIYKKASM